MQWGLCGRPVAAALTAAHAAKLVTGAVAREPSRRGAAPERDYRKSGSNSDAVPASGMASTARIPPGPA